MRHIDPRVEAISSILANPDAERGYESLERAYASIGMDDAAEAVRFLIGEKFNVDRPNPDPE